MLWLLIALVVVGLVLVVPRKRSWGPVTYRRKSFVGGPISGRALAIVLVIALAVLLFLALTH